MATWPLSSRRVPVSAATMLLVSVVSIVVMAAPARPVTAAPATAASAGAAPAPSGRVAVLPLEIIGDVPAGRPALEAAVAKGLVVAGMPVTIGPDVGITLSAAGARVACVDPACWIAAGRALGARHLIAGSVERKGAVFQVEFRLVDAAAGAGREVLKEANHCDVADCSVAELCRLTVHELARSGLSRPTAPAVATTAAPAPAATPARPSTPPVATASAPVAREGAGFPASGAPPSASDLSGWSSPTDVATKAAPATPFFPRWFPVAAVVGGVVAGGIGSYLIYQDGKCASEAKEGFTCKDVYHNMVPGVATLAGGAVLIATGIVVGLTRADDETAAGVTSVSVGPASVGLAGRF
jgi:hypothetical protein